MLDTQLLDIKHGIRFIGSGSDSAAKINQNPDLPFKKNFIRIRFFEMGSGFKTGFVFGPERFREIIWLNIYRDFVTGSDT